jgi:hypothetical protein
MKAGRVNSQLSTPNSQRPKEFTLGVGGWELAVDALSFMRSATAPKRLIALVATMLIGGSTSLLACPVCFGAEESPLIDGAKLGVVVLVVITLAVQGGFVGFFLYLRKRAKQVAELELEDEWLDLQRGSRSS